MTQDSSGRGGDADFLVIGAGIAGASAGYGLARHGRVIVLEQESVPGYHTTGRSAAFFAETYGGEAVRRLTTASKGFFLDPPAGFAETPLVRDRGALFIARPDQEARLDALYVAKQAVLPTVSRVGPDFIKARSPVIRPGYAVAGVWDPDCRDIDVHALHQGFLAAIRRQRGRIVTSAGVVSLTRRDGLWQARTASGDCFRAPVLINAAGAWGDEIACLAGARPVGLIPKRRTVIVFTPQAEFVDERMPLVLDADDRFYFKPESGRILASPGDATPLPPQDVQPDEQDLAIAVARLQAATRFEIPKLNGKWAGLRTFAPDDVPVVGEDPSVPGFYWFCGQGGYGMQTAPAMAELLECLVTGTAPSARLRSSGVTETVYSPRRFEPAPGSERAGVLSQ